MAYRGKPKYAVIDEQNGHAIDPDVVNQYDKLILDIIYGRKPVPLTHCLDGKLVKYEHIHRLLDLTKQKKYERRMHVYKPALHWGQLKLFLSEVEFLTLALQNNPEQKEIWFVYAGAAPGHHIQYLSKLFPMVHFELYDPNDFVVKDTDMIKTHVQFFMDDDAKYWATSGKTIVFCSDIRTEPATQENIVRNMAMQLEWWKIMNPELSMFKFRLPWEPGKTEYPEGDIYIQAYPGPTSSETRLVCKKGAHLKLYDNTEYEDACFYHNSISRAHGYRTAIGPVTLARDGLDSCYDCASFIHIMYEYVRVMGRSVGDLRQLLNDVQHEISFGRASVYSQSIKYFGEALTNLTKAAYVKCRNKRCVCCTAGAVFKNPIASGISKATIKNETAQSETRQKKKTLKDADLDQL